MEKTLIAILMLCQIENKKVPDNVKQDCIDMTVNCMIKSNRDDENLIKDCREKYLKGLRYQEPK